MKSEMRNFADDENSSVS